MKRDRSPIPNWVEKWDKDLAQMVKKGRFREDLYYRINGVHINIPPLRKRKSDIPALIEAFLQKEANQHLKIDDEALNLLLHYDWPGNIRELRNTIHYALNMTESMTIHVQHLPEHIRTLPAKKLAQPGNLKEQLARTERDIIEKTIRAYGTSVEAKKLAAKELGISLATLYNKLSQYHIDF